MINQRDVTVGDFKQHAFSSDPSSIHINLICMSLERMAFAMVIRVGLQRPSDECCNLFGSTYSYRKRIITNVSKDIITFNIFIAYYVDVSFEMYSESFGTLKIYSSRYKRHCECIISILVGRSNYFWGDVGVSVCSTLPWFYTIWKYRIIIIMQC